MCRFGYPRDEQSESLFDPVSKAVTLRRENANVNNYNAWLLYAMRCNMDIQFVGASGSAAASFYMCEYITKSALSSYIIHTMMHEGVLRLEADERGTGVRLDARERSRRLLLKCVNRVGSQMEFSGQQVMAALLGNPNHYTGHTFREVYLGSIVSWMRRQASQQHVTDDGAEPDTAAIDESANDEVELVQLTPGGGTEVTQTIGTLRTDYVERGDGLAHLSLYEYVSSVEKITRASETRRLSRHTAAPDTGGRPRGRPAEPRFEFNPERRNHLQRMRTQLIVPNVLGFIPSESANLEGFARMMLVLLKPFETPVDLVAPGQKWAEAFAQWEQLGTGEYAANILANIRQMQAGRRQQEEERARKNALGNSESDEQRPSSPRPPSELDAGGEEGEHEGDDPALETEGDVVEGDPYADAGPSARDGLEQRYADSALQAAVECLRVARAPAHAGDGVGVVWLRNGEDLRARQQWFVSLRTQAEQLFNASISAPLVVSQPQQALAWVWHTAGQQGPAWIAMPVVLPTPVNVRIPFLQIAAQGERPLVGEQLLAFQLIAEHVEATVFRGEQREQMIMYVGGAGGTGKSEVIKAVTRLFDAWAIPTMLRRAAFTGVAANNIGGSTIHALTGMRHGDDKDGGAARGMAKRRLEQAWRHVRYLICDEASMIGCRLLGRSSGKVQEARGNTSEPFGGVNLLFFGDFNQLQCVEDSPLYARKDFGTSEQGVLAAKGLGVWHALTHVVFLVRQHRIQDAVYQAVLERVCEGEGTDADFDLLCTRLLSNPGVMEEYRDDKFRNAMFLSSRCLVRSALVRAAAMREAHEKGVCLVVAQAEDTFPAERDGARISPALKEEILSLRDNKTKSLLGRLHLVPGMRLALTHNMQVPLKLSNGSVGILREIVTRAGEAPFELSNTTARSHKLAGLPEHLLVEFPGSTVQIAGLPQAWVPVVPITESFSVKRRRVGGGFFTLRTQRTQLPVVGVGAATAHKVQGQTLDAVVADLAAPPGYAAVCTLCGVKPRAGGTTPQQRTLFCRACAVVATWSYCGRSKRRFCSDAHQKTSWPTGNGCAASPSEQWRPRHSAVCDGRAQHLFV